MADQISFHWGTNDITVAAPAKGSVKAVTLHRPESLATDPASLGRWLRTELGKHRISGKRAAVVLPRSAAVFRKISLPNVPDDELPDLVRMQAATKSATPLDRLKLDFVPLPLSQGEGKEVLLATVPNKTVDDVVGAIRATGMECSSIGISPFSTAAKVAADGQATLIVAAEEQSAEITLVRQNVVLFSHITDLSNGDLEEDRQWLASEVSRAVVAADHHSANGSIARTVLIGPHDLLGPLAKTFEDRFGGPVLQIDQPAYFDTSTDSEVTSVAALAAAVGQLETGGTGRLDFLNPRKRVEKPDRTRFRAGVAAAGVGLVIAAGYAMTWINVSDLEATAARLTDERATLETTLTSGEPTLISQSAIQEWLGQQADVTHQLTELNAALPGTDRVYLNQLELAPGGRDSLGVVKGLGAAKSFQDVRTLSDDLARRGYQVTPTSPVETKKDPEYPIRFDLEFSIPKPKSTDAADTASAT